MNEGSLGHKRMVRKITSLQLQSAKDPDNKKIAGDAYLAYGKGNFKKGFRKNRAKPGSGNYEAEIGKHYIKKASKMREDKVPPLVALKRLLKEAKEKKAYRMGKLGKPSKITDLMRKFRGGTSASKSHDAMQDAEDRADQRAEDRAKDRENIKESGEKRVNRLAARARKTEDPKDAKNAARASSKVWLRKYIKTKNKGKGDSHNAYAQKRNFSDDNRFANESKDEDKKKEVKDTSTDKVKSFWKRRNEMKKRNPQNYTHGYTGKDLKKYTDSTDHMAVNGKEGSMSNNAYVNYLAEKIMFFSELLSLNEGSGGLQKLGRKLDSKKLQNEKPKIHRAIGSRLIDRDDRSKKREREAYIGSGSESPLTKKAIEREKKHVARRGVKTKGK